MLSAGIKRISQSHLRSVIHTKIDDIGYDLIQTAEEGHTWMKKLKQFIKSNTESNKGKCDHYSQQLNSVNEEIWFGVDTEFRERQPRRSPYNNTEISMLQVFGNWTSECNHKERVMTKPVIFQLYDTQNHRLNSELLLSIEPFLTDPMYSKVFHYYSIDAHVINNALRTLNNGLKLSGFAADTMHLARLLDASSSENSLKALSNQYNPKGRHKTETLKEYALNTLHTALLPQQIQEQMFLKPEMWYEYAALDPIVTFELGCILKQLLSKQPCTLQLYEPSQECSLWHIYESMWRPFGELLVEMESNGFYIDLQYLSELEGKSVRQKEEYISQFIEWAVSVTKDENVRYMNCQSRLQLGYLFFGDEKDEVTVKVGKKIRDTIAPLRFKLPNLGLPSRDKTPKGRISFTGKILDELIDANNGLLGLHFNTSESDRNNAISSVDALRQALAINTQINTFILPLQKYVSEPDMRLHYTLNLNTETGRLSCRAPNLQNQPSSKDIFEIRKSFKPQSDDNTLIIADYAQIELRVLAYLSHCESMILAFESGDDFHSRTAASMYAYIQNDIDRGNLALTAVKRKYKKERMHAKMVNFSIAYGKTPQGLAKDLDISESEANDILDKWYSDRFEVKRWQQKQMIGAIENGYSYSLIGRRRKLFDPLHELCHGNSELHQKFVHFLRINFNINGKDDSPAVLDCDIKQQMRKNDKKSKVSNRSKKMSSLWQSFVKEYKMECGNGILIPNTTVPLNQYMRRAINSPVQSSAADIVVKCMLNIWEHKELKELGFRLLLQIHDEVILEGPKINVERAKEIVKECMQAPWNGMKQTVVFEADVKHADNWFGS